MFLFPLSKMQSAQGNFYEHAHRLMGSLVGLTSLALAIYITVEERSTRLKLAVWTIFGAVCVQGLLGGLRVTEHSIPLATMHGIFAQMVFAGMACLTAASGKSFGLGDSPAKSAAGCTGAAAG
jgi:cytochrome c oxidase assembly protein subunit 15